MLSFPSIKRVKSTLFPQNTHEPIFLTTKIPKSQEDRQQMLEELEIAFIMSQDAEKQARNELKERCAAMAHDQNLEYQLRISQLKEKLRPGLATKAIRKVKSLHF
ncbi:hypothetical protein CVT25_013040 [Psilocybe cyanescens]|uniref:Uncharacterized protein n=1 Tax=Psilocybe cyanescens TaxID=93625 RepID=A0A409XLX6_PSICY|nr:hypothetical protein CVT25_013040 [Psilocybe cyanescens]